MPGKKKNLSKTSIPPTLEIISQRNSTFAIKFTKHIEDFSIRLHRAVSTIPALSTLFTPEELRKDVVNTLQELARLEKQANPILLPKIIHLLIALSALYFEMNDYKAAYKYADLGFRKSNGLINTQELTLFKATSAFQMTLAARKSGDARCTKYGYDANYYYLQYLTTLLNNEKDEHFEEETKNCFISLITLNVNLGIAHWERLDKNSSRGKDRIVYNLRKASFYFTQTLSFFETLKFVKLDTHELIALPREIIQINTTLAVMLASCIQELNNSELTYQEKYEYFLYAKNIARLMNKFIYILKQFKRDPIDYNFFALSETEIEKIWLIFDDHHKGIDEEKTLLNKSEPSKEPTKADPVNNSPNIEQTIPSASTTVDPKTPDQKLRIIDELITAKDYQKALGEVGSWYEAIRQNPNELFWTITLIYKLAEIKMKMADDNSLIINLQKIISENLITKVEQQFICDIFAGYHDALINCEIAARAAKERQQDLEPLRLLGSLLVGKIIDRMEELCGLQSELLKALYVQLPQDQVSKANFQKNIHNGHWISNNLKYSLAVLHNAKQLFGEYQLLDKEHFAEKTYFTEPPAVNNDNNANKTSAPKVSHRKKKSHAKSKKFIPEPQQTPEEQTLPSLPPEAEKTYTTYYQDYTPYAFCPVGYFTDPYGNVYFGNHEMYSNQLYLFPTNLYIAVYLAPVCYAYFQYESYANFYDQQYYTPDYTQYHTQVPTYPSSPIHMTDNNNAPTEKKAEGLTSIGADHSTFFQTNNTHKKLQRSKSDSELYKSSSIIIASPSKTI